MLITARSLFTALVLSLGLGSLPVQAGEVVSPSEGELGMDSLRQEVRGCGVCEEARHRRSHPREGRHFGFGLTGLGPAGTVGIFADITPVSPLSIQGGWGLGNGAMQTVWGEIRFLPAPGAWTPVLGVGVDAFFGKVNTREVSFAGEQVSLFTKPLHLFGELGVAFMTRKGFSGQMAVMLMESGDPEVPVLPYPSFRMGWYF